MLSPYESPYENLAAQIQCLIQQALCYASHAFIFKPPEEGLPRQMLSGPPGSRKRLTFCQSLAARASGRTCRGTA